MQPINVLAEPAIRKQVSVRNILSVADIEGASPSVASEKMKNLQRGKQYLQRENSDSLGQYEKLFSLKQISSSSLLNSGKIGSSV